MKFRYTGGYPEGGHSITMFDLTWDKDTVHELEGAHKAKALVMGPAAFEVVKGTKGDPVHPVTPPVPPYVPPAVPPAPAPAPVVAADRVARRRNR